MTSYYVDHQFDGGNYYANAAPSPTSHDLSTSLSYDNYASIPASHPPHNPPHPSSASKSAGSYPVYDPDSPFNSPIVPVRSVDRDGRLKTKLMGVGSDGGFLTSPLVVGNHRMGANPGDIQIASPAPTPMARDDSFSSSHDPNTTSATLAAGMGMGITGVTELGAALEMGDYGNPNLKIYGLPKSVSRDRTASGELGYLPYPEHLPTTTLGRGRNNVRDVAAAPPTPSSKFVEQSFKSPPPQATPNMVPATGRRPKKNLSIKTINRAKSCSALNQQSVNQFEPLTPVSSHGPSFVGLPGVPFNSPADDDPAIAVTDPTVMPFSFADLYNFGLAADSVEEIDPRKSPYVFAKDLINADQQTGGYAEDPDFALLHGLPTPFLTHGSGFSSPSSTYLSDPSPELGPMAVPMAQPQLSSSSMLSAPSMDGSMYSVPSPNGAAPQTAGRQRVVSYGVPGPRPNTSGGVQDPHVGSPQHPNSQMQRHVSNPGYAAPRYAYPTRFSSDQGQAGPYQLQQSNSQTMWTNQQPQTTYGIHPPVDPTALFGLPPSPFGSHPMERDMSTYERNLETFEDIYDTYAGAGSGASTPGKRGRNDDDGEYDDEYVPLGGMSPSSGRAKRLRTVASAPSLTTASPSRRMRPGPKPKVTKSPQEACQSVFSAILSPPTQHHFRRANSPYHSDRSEHLGSDDDEPQQGVSSVPKEVIQSLYEGVASHTGPNGVKVPKRYVCLIEGCGRTFPRKSAIESHIQTHLEDKPFVCTQPDW
ncbi:metallothionein expression activator [Pseudohyphozyma bogoriensis]|nr:metallothionein expression activator [Pseudohyphozyma bogoriensis]